LHVSTGELKNLSILVIDAKANDIVVVPALVKRMLERNTFLFGAVDLAESSVTETVKQLQQLEKAYIQVAYEKYITILNL
jgi:snRNA-activating protein complex subunit 1